MAGVVPRAGPPGLRPGRDHRRRVHLHLRRLEPVRRLRGLGGGHQRHARGEAGASWPTRPAGEALRDREQADRGGAVIKSFGDIAVVKASTNPDLAKYENLTLGEIAATEDKHPVDVMLDIAVADDLKTVFYVEPRPTRSSSSPRSSQYPYTIPGVSDGGAHTKFVTIGRYPTETIIRFARDNPVISLEEAHWQLSALPAHCAGFNDRGTLREGAPADIVVYDLDELELDRAEVVHDLPGGEWRRVQRADGYTPSSSTASRPSSTARRPAPCPGALLRHGGDTPPAGRRPATRPHAGQLGGRRVLGRAWCPRRVHRGRRRSPWPTSAAAARSSPGTARCTTTKRWRRRTATGRWSPPRRC